jgi:hypothetical protein
VELLEDALKRRNGVADRTAGEEVRCTNPSLVQTT